MNYCTPTYFLLFLPVVVALYQLVPAKRRWIVLLAASYAFFFNISRGLVVFLLLSTASIHYMGLWLENLQHERDNGIKALDRAARKERKALYLKKQQAVVAAGVLFNIGTLLVLKYTGFFLRTVNVVLGAAGTGFAFSIPKFALPIGISFYTMQAVSYILDVYHEKAKADRNIGRLALYMSFFPSLMEGPICRYEDTAQKLWAGSPVTWHNLTFGIQRMLYGYLKKFVVADRLDILVKTVFTNYADYNGGMVALAMICYTCQLYMEFSGTMDVVIGSAEIFGIQLPENFRRPFFSKSISEFWTRWHITLGTWFRDYIFYPVSLSKPMKNLTSSARKRLGNHFGPMCASAVALFCVWSCNGLWHGSQWSYLFFGMYHFFFILLAGLTEPFCQNLADRIRLDRSSTPWTAFRIVRTIILVNFGELFFRATRLKAGFAMFGTMFTQFSLSSFTDGTIWTLGLDGKDWVLVGCGVIFVLVCSILQEKGVNLRERVAALPLVPRWVIWYAMILVIVLFGAYGFGYVPVDPIYAGF